MVEQPSLTKQRFVDCPHSQLCGGCELIDEPYDQQLAWKDGTIAELFESLAHEQGAEVRSILPMADPVSYRDKVTAPFAPGPRGPNGGRAILLGMYAKGTHRIVDTKGCPIENPVAREAIEAVRAAMRKLGLSPYDEDRHKGLVRHVVVRVGHESGEVLVTLVTNGDEVPRAKAFCREVIKRCPAVTTIVQNINTTKTNTILGQRERRLYGPGFILDSLCGLTFRISSRSFYQVNSTQTSVLYETAMDLAEVGKDDHVIDAYCGTGTIGLVAASRGAQEVVGIDFVDSAIKDARENARHNGLDQARFITGDAAEILAAGSLKADPTLVFVDPPRAGCSESFLRGLALARPKRVVYISCAPSTQLRDVRYLIDAGFKLRVIQPIDMFPHTKHIESIAVLDRKKG